MSRKVSLQVDNEVLRLLGFGPVTIITTTGVDGSTNAAPHSWVTVVCYDPPQILFSVNMKHDTYRNILETKEFVVNIPSSDLIREIWVTQKCFPYGVNELEEAALTALSSEKVKPPRIQECKAHIECRVLWTKTIGSTCLVLGNIEAISVNEELVDLDAKERAITLDRLMFISFQKSDSERKWAFAQIGKINTLIEKDGKAEMQPEEI